jgi:leucyl-tRNA synthetase
MQGFNVLYPMGYDAFGLPAENAAIKNKTHPKTYTEKAIAGIKKNQKELGLSYDWSREIATCYPEYYKWNQWIFLKMFEKGLAYRRKAPVNWCPKCKTVLANEQVEQGKCWRCENEVELKNLEQWFFQITKYADRLLKGLKKIDWPENVKLMQENWIGRSGGTSIEFPVDGSDKKLKVFTTRPDTFYGITFLVYAPEHPDVLEFVKGTKEEAGVKKFIKKVVMQEKFTRTSEESEKEGMFIGRYARNPVTNEKIPIYIANFVLPDYGTGAIIAVPAHDQRDFMFAKKYKLPIRLVIKPHSYKIDEKTMSRAFVEPGIMINSGDFDNTSSTDAIDEITKFLEKKGCGRKTISYKLRDWLISRQRYWGTPIPIIYCKKCGMQPVPEKDLPVILPTNVKFTGSGNPLAKHKSFVETKCPKCKGSARRETDTMDTFMDSNWYYMRYCSPKSKSMFDQKSVNHWMPVDQYIGGVEHAVMHLLYARFFTMVLKDFGMVKFEEPFQRLFNQGIVYKDGHKMSKSFGNVVTQEEMSKKYGIDTARLFLLFVASPESQLEWSDKGVVGAHKFLSKVFTLAEQAKKAKTRTGKTETQDRQMTSRMHKTIKSVTDNIDGFRFNLVVGELMNFTTRLKRYMENPHKDVLSECLETLVTLLSPFAPHIAEEMWEMIGKNSTGKDFVSTTKWPKANERLIDRKLDMGEEIVEQTITDAREIMKLVGKEPKQIREINIYVAPGWKHTVRQEIIRKAKAKTGKDLMSTLMKNPVIRKQGKGAVRFIESIIRSETAGLKDILSAREELAALNDSRDLLKTQLGCRINITEAAKSKSPRAARAEPGKPGIEVV